MGEGRGRDGGTVGGLRPGNGDGLVHAFFVVADSLVSMVLM